MNDMEQRQEFDRLLEQRMDRRAFIKRLCCALLVAGVPKGLEWLITPPEGVIINPDIVRKEMQDDLGLGELGKTRAEFSMIWPYGRAGVIANNAIAGRRLNGLTLEKGKKYSFLDLLKLPATDQMILDPRQDYVSGLDPSRNFPFIRSVGASGVCLTATAFTRSLALTPTAIKQWQTHNNLEDPTLRCYFSPELIIHGPRVYTRLGTDAAIWQSQPGEISPTQDILFQPLEELVVRSRLMNLQGEEIPIPSLLGYLASTPQEIFRRFSTPIWIRIAFGCQNLNRYSPQLSVVTRPQGLRTQPGLSRIVYGPDQGIASNEQFWASYDTQGHPLT